MVCLRWSGSAIAHECVCYTNNGEVNCYFPGCHVVSEADKDFSFMLLKSRAVR